MTYRFEILNAASERAADMTGVVNAVLRETINTPSVLRIETVESACWQHIEAGTGFVRIVGPDGASAGIFRIIEAAKKRARERVSMTITARSILHDTTAEVFADAVTCLNHTPAELAAVVLAHSAFAVGTVEPSDAVPYVRFEYEPVLDCLRRICALTGAELALDTDTGAVDILTSVGADNGAVFRYGLNLRGASRTVNLSGMANRVYGVGGGDPPVTLSGATGCGGNKYIEDTDSITAWGQWAGICHDPTIEDIVNCVATPALDGTYTGGLCEDWSAVGTPTLSRVTAAASRLHGTASQRAQTSTAGHGVSQAVTVTPGEIYSFSAVLFLTAGTVRAEVVDGTSVYRRPSAVTGSGMVTVEVENWKAVNSPVTVRIIQDGAVSADYCVDAVQVATGASARAFTVGTAADTLHEAAIAHLTAHAEPAITYEVDLVDAAGAGQTAGDADKFGLGDTVRVYDPVLAVDVTTRVMERVVDLVRPWRVTVRLDNRAHTLADVFAALRDSQADALKYLRAAHAGSSRAAETGSSRLGFGSRTFGLTSQVTVTAWDALSWAAGSLRVGNAVFALSSGSATGLAATSTYWFYFDRTIPTALSWSTNSADAEGEDRILLFAVTTTTSPQNCVVHPHGVIHL